jgi:hypothetical protein
MVSGVVTQGRTAYTQYVKSYKVQTSKDGTTFEDVDGAAVFTANTAADNTQVENKFPALVEARYVRVVVQTWNRHISMRAAVLVCQSQGNGCANTKIESPDYSHSSASTVHAGNAMGHSHGKGRLDSDQAWSAGTNAAGQWWQMDLGVNREVSGVVTQGRTAANQYVKSYKVQISHDGTTFEDVDGGHVFTANTASNNVKVENVFASSVNTRYVRIVVQTWNAWISMRAAVVACTTAPVVQPTSPVANIDNNQDAGGSKMEGLNTIGSFFDFVNTLCLMPNLLIALVCQFMPKFGLVWNRKGDSTNAGYPACNIYGCQCLYHPLDPNRYFFWLGVHIPVIPPVPILPFGWKGGGVCMFLRVNTGGSGIQPGTGGIKFQASLFDILQNFVALPMTPVNAAIIAAIEVATNVISFIGFGFSTDWSLQLNLKGQPPLLVNARRRTSSQAGNGCAQNGVCIGGTEDKEYFWQCKHHTSFAFPADGFDAGHPGYDPYCSKLNANLWLGISINPMELKPLKTPQTKPAAADEAEGEQAKPLSLSDLFSLSFDIHLLFSVDNLGTVAANIMDCISPVAAFSLFTVLLKLQFSIMATGNLHFTLLLGKFSGGLFNDWMIKLGAVLLYFRKGANLNFAFYLTFSLGEAANDMETFFTLTPNTPATKSVAGALHKNFAKDDVKDTLAQGQDSVDAPYGHPTGLQYQVYGILTGCTGDFPHMECNLNSKSVGFGFKACILFAGDNGFSTYIEKPLEDPTEGKPDTLVFCVSDLKEEEPACLNLGFLLFLLNCLLALAEIVLAIAQSVQQAFERVGKFVATIGQHIATAVNNCFPSRSHWMRRRSYCKDFHPYAASEENKYCWGPATWLDCDQYGVNPFPMCRLFGIHPMCLNGKIDDGGDCHGHSACKSGYCDVSSPRKCSAKKNAGQPCPDSSDGHTSCASNWCYATVDGSKRKCCSHWTGDIAHGYRCSNLATNHDCDWKDQCQTGFCDGKKCKPKKNNGANCLDRHGCKSNLCWWTVHTSNAQCCSAVYTWGVNKWCKNLSKNSGCDWHQQCSSGFCDGSNKCKDKKNTGQACNYHEGCKSNHCYHQTSASTHYCCASGVTYFSGTHNYCANLGTNTGCYWNKQCQTGWCNGGKCSNTKNTGHSCSEHFHCKSNHCYYQTSASTYYCCPSGHEYWSGIHTYCANLGTNTGCYWGGQCQSRWCNGGKCKDERRRRERRRRRTRRRRKLNNGGGCSYHYHCNSNKCYWTSGHNSMCCSSTYTWVHTYCASLNNNQACHWSEQCNSRWCSGSRCKNKPNRRRRRRRRGTRRRRWW